MDWIDPRYASATEQAVASENRKTKSTGRGGKKSKPLSSQVTAALAQPLPVWSVAFDHAINSLKWPEGCSAESSFLWSTVMQEQAEVLVRSGLSGNKLASILAETEPESDKEKATQLSEIVGLMNQSLETQAFEWIDTADAYPHSALAVAAIAWHIPDHARRPGGEWLTQWLQAAVDRVMTNAPDHAESVLCNLVLHCELPLLTCLATAPSKRTLLTEASKAMDYLAEYLERAQDEPGPWLAHGATYLRAALASVLRCRVLANGLGLRKWYPPQQKALANLLTHAARWSRTDGTQMLGAGKTSPRAKAIWEALLKQTRRPKAMVAAMTLSGLIPGKRSDFRSKNSRVKLSDPTEYSKAASCVAMQSDWEHRGSRLSIDFSDTEVCLEALGPKGHPILVGEWSTKVDFEGQAQLQLAEWEEVCWFSDDDVDYLELEAKFGQDARVQRQAILFKSDRLLLLADALLCDCDGDWSIESQIPIAPGVTYEPELKTNEGFLHTENGSRCIAVPLFMPEWRRELSSGGFSQNDDSLIVRNETQGNRRLYSPVLFSLCNRHSKKPYTWRRLTVGEDLRIVGPDEAAAYRIQLGKEQLVMYRTLAKATRRTALGMHILADFYAGRFDAEEGEAESLVEVEASEV